MKDKPSFTPIPDAYFEIIGLLRLEEGEFTHCAFCGCRIKYPILGRRNDGTLWRVSRYCIQKVDLELTGKEKTFVLVKEGDTFKYKEVEEEQPKVEEEEEEYFSLDDVFED